MAQTPPPPAYGTSRSGLPTGCDKAGVTFRSPRTGWLTGYCAAGRLVLVSADAGSRWSAQRLPVTSPACLGGCFVNPPQFIGRAGFLAFSHFPAVAYLLVSTDGGASWQLRHLPAGAGPYPQIRFFSPRQGIIVSAGAQDTSGACSTSPRTAARPGPLSRRAADSPSSGPVLTSLTPSRYCMHCRR